MLILLSAIALSYPSAGHVQYCFICHIWDINLYGLHDPYILGRKSVLPCPYSFYHRFSGKIMKIFG